MHDQLRVAIVGTGAIARDQHLPAWSKVPFAKVVAAADASRVILDLVADQFEIERRTLDYRELLEGDLVDVVDICVPSALHAQVACDALGAGKHVLCEKPLATSREDAQRILQAYESSGKKLMVGQHLRFDPNVRRLHNYLQTHPAGRIYYARAQWLRRRRLPARPGFTQRTLSGGGALYDLGVHMLDLSWWLCGCPRPISVTGFTFNHLARRRDVGSEWGVWDPAAMDVEDFACGLIRLDGGTALHLEVSWLALQPEDEFYRLQIFGDQAGIVWPDNIVFGESDAIPWDLKLGDAKGEKGHYQVVAEFADAVFHDKPVPVPPTQSATMISVLDSLYRSAASGREEAVEAFDCPS